MIDYETILSIKCNGCDGVWNRGHPDWPEQDQQSFDFFVGCGWRFYADKAYCPECARGYVHKASLGIVRLLYGLRWFALSMLVTWAVVGAMVWAWLKILGAV